MKQIEAKIVADSISPQGHRITSFILTYPRFIHSELMTHRVFSRNSASSRAIPFEKMVKMVQDDPFIPIAWQRDHKGMQGTEYFPKATEMPLENITSSIERKWIQARDAAVVIAKRLHEFDVTKQLCNRLLEPFMWHTVLVTATEYENFFELRCPQYHLENVPTVNEDLSLNAKTITLVGKSKKELLKQINEIDNDSYTGFKNIINKYSDLDWLYLNKCQAEIHIQALAEAMLDAMNENTPKELKAGEWHIPFGDKISDGELRDYFYNVENNPDPSFTAYQEAKLKISTARCARLSYMTFDGEINYQKDIKLHDQLIGPPFHASPFENCARAMSDKEYANFSKTSLSNLDNRVIDIGWCNNFKGFIQYRYLIENNYE